MKVKNIIFAACTLVLIACGCVKQSGSSNNKGTTVKAYEQVSPTFDSDSAYAYVENQVKFGPRVPNTKQHVACGDYLVAELKRFGAQVQEQKMIVVAFDGTKLNSRNIIGSFGLDKEKRILLFAHWDTRPFSDHDADKTNHNKPLLGANDGASGVGVLLEVARTLQQKETEVGIDIIFFDSEDYGPPVFNDKLQDGDWWCLGSQYWSKNPHVPGYKAQFGILLDMVGGHDATFYREGLSMMYARNVVEKVWQTARQLDYGKYFQSQEYGAITDDHLPVNMYGIPSIDIIQLDPQGETGFGHYWHTQKDDMSNVSKETLKAVGQTVLEVVYKEK